MLFSSIFALLDKFIQSLKFLSSMQISSLSSGSSTAQPHNRTTAQPHNRTTAQPHNRTTAQPLLSAFMMVFTI
jgi:hypothetical protein